MLFSNIDSDFELCGYQVSRKFSNAIWVKNNRLITCMKGAMFSSDISFAPEVTFKTGDILDIKGIRKILNARGIKYIEFQSAKPENNIEQETTDIPETWFGRGNEVFIESLANISDKKAVVYPNATAKLVLKFYHTPTSFSIIDERVFAGLIELDNKILLSVVPSTKIQKLAKATATLNARGLSESSFEPLNYRPLIGSFNNVIQFLMANGYEYYIDEGEPNFLNNKQKQNIK
jgi:hypothetical protein